MQELAEAGACVLNAQAVEFAKERGIALYARASAGGPGETVIRRGPPRAAGRVVGVAGENRPPGFFPAPHGPPRPAARLLPPGPPPPRGGQPPLPRGAG